MSAKLQTDSNFYCYEYQTANTIFSCLIDFIYKKKDFLILCTGLLDRYFYYIVLLIDMIVEFII